MLTLIGLLGVLIWPGQPATTREARLLKWFTRVSWPLLTVWLIVSALEVYPQLAALGAGLQLAVMQIGLAAWLLVSGSMLTQQRARALLLGAGLLVAAGTIGVWAARTVGLV